MLAFKGGYEVITILFNSEIISETQINKLLNTFSYQPETISVSKDVYQRLAYRDTTEGVLAVAKSKTHDIDNLNFKTKNPLILVAE